MGHWIHDTQHILILSVHYFSADFFHFHWPFQVRFLLLTDSKKLNAESRRCGIWSSRPCTRCFKNSAAILMNPVHHSSRNEKICEMMICQICVGKKWNFSIHFVFDSFFIVTLKLNFLLRTHMVQPLILFSWFRQVAR